MVEGVLGVGVEVLFSMFTYMRTTADAINAE